MSFNETSPLQIPSNLVKPVKLQGKDTLSEKFNFDLIGTNGYIEIDPFIVKFSGFEAGKVNIAKTRIINCSSKSQRVHILPPSTPFFSIKFDKKGQLAPGMSEDIFIHFTPNDYKYYFDCIRVHTSEEQLQIPIHAYPVMNREGDKEIFPRVIDFGICTIGSVHNMRFPLSCKIPLNFEYEFVLKREASEIRLTPSKGLIPGKGSVEIEVSFNPTSALTIVSEYELTVSQFDFEPIKVKIMGSGKLKDKNQNETINDRSLKKTKLNKLDHIRISAVDNLKGISEKASESLTTFLNMKDQEKLLKESIPPIAEENNKTYKPLIQSQKSHYENSFSPKKKGYNLSDLTRMTAREGVITSERQTLEKQFLERFNQIQMLDKEKNIKFFQCIGDPQLRQDEIDSIKKEKEDNYSEFLSKYENEGISRYQAKFDQGLPVVSEITPKYSPTYDLIKNDNIRKRRRVLHKLMSYVSKKILKSRKKKRLEKIKKFLNGAKSSAEVKKLVELDWQKAEYFGVGKRDFVMFNFQYSNNSILDLRLPLQIETSAANHEKRKFELNQRIGFDDFTPIDPLPYSDIEVMSYSIIDPPMIINYPPIEINRKDRKGAEEEYSISGPTGPVEKVSETLELMEAVPVVLKKPLSVEPYKFVCPHPKLKNFTSYFEVTETDPEFELQPSKIQFQDSLDPRAEGEYETLYREFLTSAPGMEGIRAVSMLPLEFTNYYTHKFNLVSDFGYEENWEKLCPDLLDKAYDEDKFSDSDSDEHNSIHLECPDVHQFLNNLENEESKIKDLRVKNEGDIFDEREGAMFTINKNLENEKKLWCVTLTTKVYECDKNIANKDKLLNLL